MMINNRDISADADVNHNVLQPINDQIHSNTNII